MTYSKYLVNFPDTNMEQARNDTINEPLGEIYRPDLEGLTRLSIEKEGVHDLAAIGFCEDLEVLNILDDKCFGTFQLI